MSINNTANTFIDLVKSISTDVAHSAGQTVVNNATVVSLVNPYTKEYKVEIDAQIVTAYALYDEAFNIGDSVAILVATEGININRYILRKTDAAYNPSSPGLDHYDQIGKTFSLIRADSTYAFKDADRALVEDYIARCNDPYVRFKVTSLSIGANAPANFYSGVSFTFKDSLGQAYTYTYSTAHLEGAVKPGVTLSEQYSPYFQLKPTIVEFQSGIADEADGVTWGDISFEIYDRVPRSAATEAKILALDGFEITADSEELLRLQSKLRIDYEAVDSSKLTVVWEKWNSESNQWVELTPET